MCLLGCCGWYLEDILQQLPNKLHIFLDVIVVLFDELVIQLSGIDLIIEIADDSVCHRFRGKTKEECDDKDELVVKAIFRMLIEEGLHDISDWYADSLWISFVDDKVEEFLQGIIESLTIFLQYLF